MDRARPAGSPGQASNLPGGQLNALCDDIDGIYVANGSSSIAFNGSADLRGRPITFTLAGGRIQQLSSPDAGVQAAARSFIKSADHADRVGHLVLGANPGITSSIGEVMVDTCAPGLQLVFGWTNQSVTRARWTSTASLALAGSSGDLDVDGKPLLRGGRYVL